MKYVLMRFSRWRNMEAQSMLGINPIVGPGRSIGCLLVYDSLGDLRKDHPKADYVAIEEMEDSGHE